MRQSRAQQYRDLLEICRLITRSLDYRAVLPTVTEQAARLLGGEAAVLLLSEEPSAPRVAATYNISAERTASLQLALGQGLMEALRALCRDAGLPAFVGVPLVLRGDTIGTLAVYRRHRRRPGASAEELLSALADQAAIAIDNVRLYEAERRAHAEARAARQQTADVAARLGTVITNAPLVLFALDPAGVFTLSEGKGLEVLGLRPGEVVGRSVFEVYRDDPGILEHVRRGLAGEAYTAIDEVKAIGEVWETRWTPLRDRDGNLTGAIGVALNITERKQAEAERERLVEQLDAERARFQTILDSALHGIVFVEAGTDRLIVNPAATRLLGYQLVPEAGRVQYVGTVCRPDGQPLTLEELPSTGALRGQTTQEKEFLIVLPDGQRIPVLASAAPVRDPEGKVMGAVVSFQDISALKELERRREEWTSVVAHELRQPLTIIRGYVSLLQRLLERQARPQEAQAIDHIGTAATNLSKMIDDLIEVSRIEARRLKLERETVDLPALVREVVERTAAVTREHPFGVEVRGSIPPISADPRRLEQVLGNLLSNAAKYGYPATEIRVAVARRAREVEVAVANEGEGISPDDMPNLFTRFHRARQAEAERITGLGLGLYISKGLVEAHDGRIWAESTPGETTTFRFTLPVG